MKKVLHILSLYIVLVLMILGVTSCVKDDLSDCPPVALDNNVKVVVRMPWQDTKDYYDFDVKSIDLYVFSETNGKYVGGYKIAYNANTENQFLFKLQPGDYRFVAWTNLTEPYKVNYTREEALSQGISYNEMKLSFDPGTDRVVQSNMPDLLFGHLTDAKVKASQNTDFIVQAIPYTNRINLTAEGLPANADGYTLSVTDNNSQYTFDNNYVLNDRTLTYKRALTTTSDNKWTTSMKVLRLTDPAIYPDKTDPVIRLTNNATSAIVYDKDLIKIIKKSYSDNGQTLDFDKETVFNIRLKFNADMEATLSVNGWNMSNQPEELE